MWHSRPSSTLRHGWVVSLGQAFGLADQVRQTGLPQPHPLAIHSVTVSNQNAGPSLDKFLERGLGAPGMDHEQCRAGAGQNPKPDQFGLATPRGLVNMPTDRDGVP